MLTSSSAMSPEGLVRQRWSTEASTDCWRMNDVTEWLLQRAQAGQEGRNVSRL